MKAERHSTQHIFIGISNLNISVNGFGHTNNLNAIGKHFLGQKGRVGVGIIAADNHKSVQIQPSTGFAR